MNINELLTKLGKELGYPDSILKAAAAHADSYSGAGSFIEGTLNRDLTEEEIKFYTDYAVTILQLGSIDPKFREEFMKRGTPVQSDN